MGCKGPPCCQDSLKGQTPAAQRGPMYSGGWRMTVSFPPRARARKPEGALCSSLAVSFLEGPSVCGEQVSGSARGGGGGGLASSTGCETLGGLVHKTGFPWLPKSDPWGLGEAGGGGGVRPIVESYSRGALGHLENLIKVANPLLEGHSRRIGRPVQQGGLQTPDAHFEPCPGQEPCFHVSLNPCRPWGSWAESTAPGPSC